MLRTRYGILHFKLGTSESMKNYICFLISHHDYTKENIMNTPTLFECVDKWEGYNKNKGAIKT